ncbi:MAG: PspA/IM30 family protein [Candidatus Sericytochromatia bacterium]
MGFFSRIANLWKGFLSLFVENLEEKNPEAVYEAAIISKTEQYQKLMKAVSGIVYLRNKLEKELEEKTKALSEVQAQIPVAVEQGDDEVTLVLLEKKNSLIADVDRIKSEVEKISVQADEAKENLIRFQAEIEKLKSEKQEMLARRENALAQKKVQDQLSNITIDSDLKALSSVREGISKLEAQVQVAKEVNNNGLDSKLRDIKEKTASVAAKTELEELKKKMNAQKNNINIEKKL